MYGKYTNACNATIFLDAKLLAKKKKSNEFNIISVETAILRTLTLGCHI